MRNVSKQRIDCEWVLLNFLNNCLSSGIKDSYDKQLKVLIAFSSKFASHEEETVLIEE